MSSVSLKLKVEILFQIEINLNYYPKGKHLRLGMV